VLTGDKIETAINVGYASGLLDDESFQYIIDGVTSVDIYKQMCISKNNIGLYAGNKNIAIIVAGDSLLKITCSELLQKRFEDLINYSTVVLACRVSPKQKAEIV
jgi:magnesium-transporting ATPase (P-type)